MVASGSQKPLRMYSAIGRRAPAYCTAIGKALLAWAPLELLNRLLGKGNLYRFTEYTIVEPYRIKEELHNIRECGYAEDREEHELGICCVAAPIRNMAGEVTAAISLALPTLRFQEERFPYLRKVVIEAAQDISSRLGCPAHLLE